MKRFLKYLLTFIVPKKMEQHRDMNLFISVLIFLLCAIMCPGIGSIRLEKTLKNNYLDECYAYEDTYDLTMENFDINSLPSFSINPNTNKAENVVWPNNTPQSVYEIKYKAKEGLDVNLTIVYEFDKDNNEELDFNLNEYLSVNPFDGNKNLMTRDVLVVYTESVMYYIFNRGYVLSYMNIEDANLESYHYLNVSSWEQTGKWSIYKVERDDNGNVKLDASGKPIYLPNAENKEYTNNINQLFTFENAKNVGVYSYYELNAKGFNYNALDNPLINFTDIMVDTCADSVGTYSYILSFFYIVILPILWILVIWLLMRKNAELTRFREYYSVCAISFILPSLIAGIVGLWVPYTIMAKIIMIVQAIFFFIVVTSINSIKNKTNKKVDAKIEEIISISNDNYKVETSPIQDVLTDDQQQKKASIIE